MDVSTVMLVPGTSAEQYIDVTPDYTASHWGSGSVAVLATPVLVGLMEQAAVALVDRLLPPGHVSVGTLVNVRHLQATAPGVRVTGRATLTEIDGRRLVFHVEAHDNGGLVAEGTHERAVVNLERFLVRAKARSEQG